MLTQTELPSSATVRADLRRVFDSGHTRTVAWRRDQLRGIERFCDERQSEIAAALDTDLGRPAVDVFSSSRMIARALIDRIPSGGAVVNHIAMHCLVPQLPFGGVGASGMGAYHGRWGFDTLSHRRSVLAKHARPDFRLVYPPYSTKAQAILRKIF